MVARIDAESRDDAFLATQEVPLAAPERTSLALHAAVAAKLLQDPQVLGRARDRVAAWLHDGSVHPWYVEAWAHALNGTSAQVAGLLTDTGERACAMRQASPFAGALTVAERAAVLRACREEARHEPRAA